jgi:hypothetical protein
LLPGKGSTILATPAAFRVPVPIRLPSAKKVIVPVGMPPDAEEAFAVMVSGWNCGSDAAERETATVALPVVTVIVRAGAVLLP